MGSSLRVVWTVAGRGPVGRLALAGVASMVAEFGAWIAILVLAYDRGGPFEAGAVAIAQQVPAIAIAPVLVAHLARHGLHRLLVIGYVGQTVGLAVAAVALLADAPALVAYAGVMVQCLFLSIARPTQSSLLPRLVRHRDELTAANVAVGWSEGVGFLAGPALAGLVVGTVGIGVLFTGLAVALAAGTGLVASIGRRAGAADDAPPFAAGSIRLLRGAATIVARQPSLRSLFAYPAVTAVVEGAVDLLCVTLAATVVAFGDGGAGYLNATVGAGGLLGGALAAALVGRRLANPLLGGTLLGATALGILALAGSTPVVVALLGVVGGVRAVQLLAAQTLLQRTAPPEVLVHVLALQEGVRVGGIAVGALLAPTLIGLGGASAAFAGLAGAMALAVVLTARRVRAIEIEPGPAMAAASPEGVPA